MREIDIAVIDPFPERREELAQLIRKCAGNQTGRLRIRQYGGADECPRQEIGCCHAIFMTLNSGEDVAAAHRLRPAPDSRWPLVVVTDYGRFSLDSHALWARHCLRRPLKAKQVAEALRRCLDPEIWPEHGDFFR